MKGTRFYAALELILLFGVWFANVWGAWRLTGASLWTVAGFLSLGGIITVSITVQGPDWKDRGFRLDNLRSALAQVVAPVFLFAALFCGVLYLTETRFEVAPASEATQVLAGGLWQQAFFLGYLLQRWNVAAGSPIAAVVANALSFGLVHLPHLFLTALTFLGGIFLGALFLRARNVFVLGLVHGVLSILLVPTLRSAGLIETTQIGPPELARLAEEIDREWRPGDRIGIGPHAVRLNQLGRSFKAPVEFIGDHDAGDLSNSERLAAFFRAEARMFCILTEADFLRATGAELRAQLFVLGERFVFRRKFSFGLRAWKELLYGNSDRAVLGILREKVLLISNRPRRFLVVSRPDEITLDRGFQPAGG